MESQLKANLRALGDQFLANAKIKSATLWMRAAKDARFLDRIESGKGFTVKTYDGLIRWFSNNWPDGAIWPDGVERPALTPAPLPDGRGEDVVTARD